MAIPLFSANQTAMRAKAALGMRVEIAVTPDTSGGYYFIDDETIQSNIMGYSKMPATIIGLYNPDVDGVSDVMIGWKLSEIYPSNASHPSGYDPPHSRVADYRSYERVRVWSPGIYVVSIVSEVSVIKVKARKSPDGEKCYCCSDFVYMAEPNLPDGKFVCSPCKKSPYSKYNLS